MPLARIGSEPAWSPRGDEIFFRNRDGFVAVPVDRDRTTAIQVANIRLTGSSRS